MEIKVKMEMQKSRQEVQFTAVSMYRPVLQRTLFPLT